MAGVEHLGTSPPGEVAAFVGGDTLGSPTSASDNLIEKSVVIAGRLTSTPDQPPARSTVANSPTKTLLVVALVARPGRRLVALTALLAGLTVLQVLLPSLRTGLPWLAALHVLVAVAIGVQAAAIARAPIGATEATSPPDTAGNLPDALRGLSP